MKTTFVDISRSARGKELEAAKERFLRPGQEQGRARFNLGNIYCDIDFHHALTNTTPDMPVVNPLGNIFLEAKRGTKVTYTDLANCAKEIGNTLTMAGFNKEMIPHAISENPPVLEGTLALQDNNTSKSPNDIFDTFVSLEKYLNRQRENPGRGNR